MAQPRRDYHNQIDYIMVKQRFQSNVNIAKTSSFPGADIGSDLQTPRQRNRKPGQHKDQVQSGETQVSQLCRNFSSNDRGKFAPLLVFENQDTEIDALINSFSTAVTETANNILGKHRPAKKPSVTDNILKLCDRRRELKQKKNTTEDAKLYREANQQVKKIHEKSKGDTD